MSRRITWLVVAITVSVTLAVIVYSRQLRAGQGEQQPAKTVSPTPQQDAGPTKPDETEKPKEICMLSLANAPDIGGIRLGMTTEQVLALFPGSKDNAEVKADLKRPATKFGGTALIIRPEAYGSGAKFPGAKHITLTFLDGRVSNFSIGYNGPKWEHVDDFVSKFSEGRNLPDAWEAHVGMDMQRKFLKCDGFEINLFTGGKDGSANSVRISDLSAQRKLEERRAKEREKAARESKP